MGGGLLQLVAYGAQDVYLTGNPQITFFKVVYRRHTNFALESILQTFNGNVNFGSRVTATISRNGDLINRAYLVLSSTKKCDVPYAALKVIKEWGFEYKTCGFSWVKKNKKADSLFWGMGYYTRSNNEICLLATKGKPKRVSSGVHQVVIDKIREHSRKPDCVRDRIVKLCGDLPRIELFARQKTPGWDVWGNEV